MRDPRDRMRRRLFSQCEDPERAARELASSLDRYVRTDAAVDPGEHVMLSLLDEDSGLMVDVDAVVVARGIGGVLVRGAAPLPPSTRPRTWPVPTRFVPSPSWLH